MFGVLDLDWQPSAKLPEMPVGHGPAIVRNDTYAHRIRILDGVENGYDTADFEAQVRLQRVGPTEGDPVAIFTVVTEVDGADVLVTFSLTSAETTALGFSIAYWDLQVTQGVTVTTLLSGRVRVANDVTRTGS